MYDRDLSLSFPIPAGHPGGWCDLIRYAACALQLLEHLPRSVSGVGDELARGDPDLEPFEAHIVGKIKPSELLGFVVVVRSCC